VVGEGVTTLADEYERVCATPSDIYLHLPRFVAMVLERDAQHVIELGTRTGVSTIAWLDGLSQTGGRLTSVDIDERPAIGEFEHWSFIQGDDLDPDVVAQLDECDILFLDTSHLYDHTVAELRIYRHLVRPGGILVCHDTMLERPEGAPARPRFPVACAIEEFCRDEGLQWRNIPECWGLGVIQL
jgi:cephalosporin hydroxylase